MSNEKLVIKQGLIGGTAADLDSISYLSMTTGNVAFVTYMGISYVLTYDSTSSATENSPYVIAPDDVAANPGRWLLKPDFGLYNENLLLNPSFIVNQDVYDFTSSPGAGAYLFDGWLTDSALGKLVNNGDGTYTPTAVMQIIDNTDIDATTVTVSAEITTGTIDVYTGGANSNADIGTLASVGTLSVTNQAITFDIDIGTKTYPVLWINGTGKFKKIKLESGYSATRFVKRGYSDELAACQNYLFKTYDDDTAIGTVTGVGADLVYAFSTGTYRALFNLTFPRAMARIPTIYIYSTATGNVGNMRSDGMAADVTAVDLQTSRGGTSVGNSLAITTIGIARCHIVANARL